MRRILEKSENMEIKIYADVNKGLMNLLEMFDLLAVN